jgi:hypothetical protein
MPKTKEWVAESIRTSNSAGSRNWAIVRAQEEAEHEVGKHVRK